MEELAKKMSGVYYIATDDSGQPRVRPFDNAAVIDAKLYIGTSRNKDVFIQIKKNPKVEIFVMSGMSTTRFSAEAHEETNEEINKKAFLEMNKDYHDDSVALRLEKIKLR